MHNTYRAMRALELTPADALAIARVGEGLSFPEQLRAHRERLRLPQHALAELLGVAERTYCTWERDDDPLRKPHQLTQEGALARLRILASLKDESSPGQSNVQDESQAGNGLKPKE